MDKSELFDLNVERFLRKQMSPEEENDFKEELSNDSEKLSRAKTIALAVKSMKYSGKDKDKNISEAIKITPNCDLESIIKGQSLEDFDLQTELFLKGLMTADEENVYKDRLRNSTKLQERAKVISLSILEFKESQKTKDASVMQAIKDTNEAEFEKIIKTEEDRDTDFIKVLLMMFKLRKATNKKDKVQTTDSKIRYFSYPQSEQYNKNNSFIKILSVAAIFTLIFSLGIKEYHESKIIALGNDYKELVCRSNSSDTFDKEVTAITQLIDTPDSLSVAKERISKIDNYTSNIYIVKHELSSEEQTIAILKWNLAISYLKNGEGKKAREILKDIAINYPELGISEKASKLIEDIDNIYWF